MATRRRPAPRASARRSNPDEPASGPLVDPARLRRALDALSAELDEHGIKSALVGGLALAHYGSPRLTGDLDVAVDRMLPEAEDGEPLVFGGRQVHVEGVETDLILRADRWRKLYADAVANARRLPGLPMRVATPEHLALMKIAANRTKDTLDLEWMLGTPGVVDYGKAMKLAKRFLGEFGEQTLEDARIMADVKREAEQRKGRR